MHFCVLKGEIKELATNIFKKIKGVSYFEK
jgi:hypothetical protein